ncbi:hypothetical protein CEW46_21205 [Bacillus cereus]|nr:hypothetical protein CEW46_21205 [Bacillus cereus]
MANSFTLELDTTAPGSPSLKINSGATYTSTQTVTLTVATTDPTTTGYTMKVWGDVDKTDNPSIQDTKEASAWIQYNTAPQVKLSAGDGSKSLSLIIRDDVFNEATTVTATISLDTKIPVITVTGPDVAKISKVAGKNVSSGSFIVDVPFTEYKIKVVPNGSAINTAGTQIPVTAGSTNMTGTGSFNASTPINFTINGTDLEVASAGDGNKTIKIFVKGVAGNWSV